MAWFNEGGGTNQVNQLLANTETNRNSFLTSTVTQQRGGEKTCRVTIFPPIKYSKFYSLFSPSKRISLFFHVIGPTTLLQVNTVQTKLIFFQNSPGRKRNWDSGRASASVGKNNFQQPWLKICLLFQNGLPNLITCRDGACARHHPTRLLFFFFLFFFF